MYRSPISKATLYLILIGKEANYTQIQERFSYIILVKYNLLPFYTPTTMQLRRNPNSKYSKRYHCAKLNPGSRQFSTMELDERRASV